MGLTHENQLHLLITKKIDGVMSHISQLIPYMPNHRKTQDIIGDTAFFNQIGKQKSINPYKTKNN